MPGAARADEAGWCSSEQSLLLSQADDRGDKYSLPLRAALYASPRRRYVPAIVRLWLTPARLSAVAAALKACRATVVRRKWAAGLLLVGLLCAVVLWPLCGLAVSDSHARWQLLAVRYVSARRFVTAMHAEVAWTAHLLLFAYGSRMQACTLDAAAHRHQRVAVGLPRPSEHFSDVYLSESEDGQSYELSTAAPSVFSPSYRPSASSPYTPARVLECSTSSRRCDVAVVELFQADLVAEMNSSNASDSASAPPFCTVPPCNVTTETCQQWPYLNSVSTVHSTAVPTSRAEAACGSGVVNVQESVHWWYYRHPMSCMHLARSIGSQHGYCVGHDPHVDEERVNFHIAMFGPKWRPQATIAVSSFLLTQNLTQSKLIVWTDRSWSELSGVRDVQTLLTAAAQHVELRVWNAYDELIASNSLLASSAAWYASIDDSQGYLRGDLMRLLLLHNYGGVWVDADVLLLRDFAPILGQQFLYKWGGHCDELNGAVVRMFKGSVLSSRFLDALYHTPPRPNSVDWGNNLYSFIHAAQQASLQSAAQPTTASLRSEHFTVFPACFFNPNWMEPAAFSPLLQPELPAMWPGLWHGPFAYHLHGEVWDEAGWAARDPTYQHVAARITELVRAQWRLTGKQPTESSAA